MKKIVICVLFMAVIAACSNEKKASTESTEEVAETKPAETVEAEVFFVLPNEGDTLSPTFKVAMGVKGMEVEPAGEVNEGKGHHHIIVDGSFIEKGQVVPADSTHIHYGKGQTEVELTLAPGNHTLTMQFADGVHSSYGEKLSKTISIVIAED